MACPAPGPLYQSNSSEPLPVDESCTESDAEITCAANPHAQ